MDDGNTVGIHVALCAAGAGEATLCSLVGRLGRKVALVSYLGLSSVT